MKIHKQEYLSIIPLCKYVISVKVEDDSGYVLISVWNEGITVFM